MKEFGKGVLYFVIALVVVGGVAYLVRNTVRPASSMTKEEYVTAGMKNCNKDGDLYNYCTCALNKAVDDYGVEESIKMDRKYAETKVIDERFNKIALYCVGN